ncbi:MAG: 23S rRNA (pseudouridine(1915)-N(3))-methyltransferase RlmH [Acidobacteriota bacterium]|jgi:23S rRNA (pseudouridine1915-N3)-methyltransferase
MADAAPHIVLCWPGKTSAEYARIGIEEYVARIKRFRRCRRVVVSEEPSGKRYTTEHRLERQEKAILDRLVAFEPYFLILLDPRGKALDSRKFATLLQRQCYDDGRTLAFVVGGPDGVSPGLRGRADLLLGLSPMTLPHDLARLFLAEQIYRGFTIIHGLPYSR